MLHINFRYLDQLGLASKYNTKVYCRQTLIGGHYGLLNTSTLVPNPDFYRQYFYKFSNINSFCQIFSPLSILSLELFNFLNSALLWHRLMGKIVLPIGTDASSYLRSYAHCSKGNVSTIFVHFEGIF